MANRILRDWTCSETINELSESAEIFFTRLIMKADDFGRFYGSPKILKAQLYPLREHSFKSIEKWRDECVNSGVIIIYKSDGKDYLEIKDFNQRLRLMKSKFPEPLSNDGQMTVKCQTIDGLKGKETEEEVETESETEVETKPKKKDAYATELNFSLFNNQIIVFYWKEWTEYKQTEHREKFKSTKTEQLAINKLGEMCGHDSEKAKMIIEQSMSNRWKGLFELKKQNNNGTINNETGRTRTLEDQADDLVRRVNALYSESNEQHTDNESNTEDGYCQVVE